MQSLKINKGLLKSKIRIPSSKSYANRALILAAVSNKTLTLQNIPKASDVEILISSLKQVGLQFTESDSTLEVLNSFPDCEVKGQTLEVGEGGTTARFLAALLLLGKMPYQLILGKRLKERPWDDFIKLGTSLGAQIRLNGDTLFLQGPISFPKVLEVDCTKTTQFATALLLIAPKSVEISPLHLLSSVSYWNMTKKMKEEFESCDIYNVPQDWSSASYPLAFGALNQKIDLLGLFPDEYQADSKFYDILMKYQAVTLTDQGICVCPGLKEGPLTYDVSDALDLVPTLAYYLSHIKGVHHLTGIKNLVHKESDRLSEVIKVLKAFNREALSDGETLTITGHHEIISHPVDLPVPEDHRMVMMGTLFLLHHSGGVIDQARAVSKSYPEFFDLISET